MKPIRILPSLKPRPPIWHPHFGNEYTVKCTKSIRGTGRLSLSKIGSCTIEAAEPETVLLQRPDEPFTVSIPLKLSLSSPPKSNSTNRGKRDQMQFEQHSESITGSQLECRCGLISSTYISVVPRRGVPTQSESHRSSSLTRNTSMCSRTTTTINLADDNNNRPTETDQWEGTVNANLTFNTFEVDDPLIPSFDSSLISHRYRIAMRIKMGRMEFSLDVPVTIRYSSTPDEDPPSFDEVPPPVLEVSTETSPSALTQSLGERFAVMRVSDLHHANVNLNNQSAPAPRRHDINLDLPDYHPRAIGIDAPPYVV